MRELRARKLAQLALIGARAFLQNNKSVRRFAPAFMRESLPKRSDCGSQKSPSKLCYALFRQGVLCRGAQFNCRRGIHCALRMMQRLRYFSG